MKEKKEKFKEIKRRELYCYKCNDNISSEIPTDKYCCKCGTEMIDLEFKEEFILKRIQNNINLIEHIIKNDLNPLMNYFDKENFKYKLLLIQKNIRNFNCFLNEELEIMIDNELDKKANHIYSTEPEIRSYRTIIKPKKGD